MGRRHFGTVRKLTSGRYQARYWGLDGGRYSAPYTFENKTAAYSWLSDKESELRRGEWYDPDAGAISLDEYAPRWIAERPNLRPRTVRLYELLYRLHIKPGLGRLGLIDITYARVRSWRAGLLDAGVGPVTVAKAYRLLKAIMTTAVEDGLIRRNPCRIKGAGTEKSPERQPATIDQVLAIAAAMEPRYKALVLLATFASLRWGELMGLHRSDIDLKNRTVRVVRAVQEIGAKQLVGPPKSDAGKRTVTFPRFIVADLEWHLRVFAEKGKEGRVFVGPKGATPLRSNFQRFWRAATEKAGVPATLHLHDLRHTGATYAADTGASTRELMKRLGHSTPRAALIYQHAREERDQAIASGLDELIKEERKRAKKARKRKAEGKPPRDEDDGDDPPLVGAPVGT